MNRGSFHPFVSLKKARTTGKDDFNIYAIDILGTFSQGFNNLRFTLLLPRDFKDHSDIFIHPMHIKADKI